MRHTLTYPCAAARRRHHRVPVYTVLSLLSFILVACAGFSTDTKTPPTPSQSPASATPSIADKSPSTASILPLGTVTLAPQGTIEGYHERNTCAVIGGWAYDSSKPDTALSVEVFDGEMYITTLVADKFRADLRDAGKGNGNHSFDFAPPARLKDGKPHQILVRIAGTNIALNGTPMSLTCTS